MSQKRVRGLFFALGLVAAVAVGGWIAGSRLVSPAEAAARTAPPTPSAILVPVEQRVLNSSIVTRGTARYGLPQPISLAPSNLKPKAGLITTLPLRNTQVEEGGVLLTTSGRAVFVFQGEIPAYRDLVPGASGSDVRQLEQALARLGCDPGPIDGVYDDQTGKAVADWYRSAGWDPFGPTLEQLALIRTLERDSSDATRARLAADSAAATAAVAVESARTAAEYALKKAAAEIAAAQAALEKLEAGMTGADKAVESARATAEHARKVAAAELAAWKKDWDQLLVDSKNGDIPLSVEAAQAKARLADTAARADIAAKISERALIVLDPRSTASSRSAADAQLELARAASFNTKLEGELAVLAAQRAASLAPEKYQLAEAALKAAELSGETSIQAALNAQKVAERDVQLARSQLELAEVAAKVAELDGGKAVQAAQDALKIARLDAEWAAERADRLAADLDFAKRKLGVQVPVDEIVFIPALPVRVHEVTTLVGDTASGPVMSVTDNQLSVDASLTLDAAPLVKPGMTVTIDESAVGIKATGVVAQVANTPGTHGVDGYHLYFEVRVDETPIPLAGYSLRLTIPIKSTEGAVTAIPISALSLAPDGSSRIQVQASEELKYITVEPGLSADGYVEIKPVQGTLEPGQLVVVGFEREASFSQP